MIALYKTSGHFRDEGALFMKILLADPSDIWVEALYEQLKDHHQVFMCTDGAEVLSMLVMHQPDLLVLGMEMPNIGGLALLSAIRASGIQVKVLTAAYIYSEYDLQMLEQFGVFHCVIKPCTVCSVMAEIYQMIHYSKDSNPIEDVTPVLLLLGLRMNLNGFRCLISAVKLLRENPGLAITKELYPQVAKVCGGTSQSVERAIRGVIKDAWLHRDDRIWMAFFSRNRNGEISQPSNGDFITRIAFGGNDNIACG